MRNTEKRPPSDLAHLYIVTRLAEDEAMYAPETDAQPRGQRQARRLEVVDAASGDVAAITDDRAAISRFFRSLAVDGWRQAPLPEGAHARLSFVLSEVETVAWRGQLSVCILSEVVGITLYSHSRVLSVTMGGQGIDFEVPTDTLDGLYEWAASPWALREACS